MNLSEDIWWPQCCWLDNDNLIIENNTISPKCRCPNPARWEIRGTIEPMVHACDLHLVSLLEEGTNTVTNLFFN